jgi:menaquinone-dependent protoporphyrinogen oxidase
MKTLILYSSYHGTTEKVARLIQRNFLTEYTQVSSLHKSKISLAEYETVIIGGSIRYGKIQPIVRDFCEENTHELVQKRLGLYICCMNRVSAPQVFDMAYPEILRQHAVACGIMGGEVLLEKMNFFEKAILRLVNGTKQSVSKIDYTAIDHFIEKIKPTPYHL